MDVRCILSLSSLYVSRGPHFTGKEPMTKLLPVLDIVASILILIGLLPVTGALPAITTSAFPLANALSFAGSLGGALLLLATGPKLLLSKVSSPAYIAWFRVASWSCRCSAFLLDRLI